MSDKISANISIIWTNRLTITGSVTADQVSLSDTYVDGKGNSDGASYTSTDGSAKVTAGYNPAGPIGSFEYKDSDGGLY